MAIEDLWYPAGARVCRRSSSCATKLDEHEAQAEDINEMGAAAPGVGGRSSRPS
jgi:hypothetical protein